MEKIKFESENITKENIDKVAELFPNVITEKCDDDGNLKRAIDFQMLRTVLGDEVAGKEAYEFTWVGKREAIMEAGRPIRKALRPSTDESKDWGNTENLYIEGDNLEVLKLLQESYLGKVKMIYIDPPYNTGNDFIYDDDYKMSREEYDEELEVYDEEDGRLFKNTVSEGRFHSNWCNMIYPRLILARNILSHDGVIFISIDDGESDNLRKIGNEVFGESNFVADLCVVNNLKGRNDKRYIARANERLLMWVKSDSFVEHGLELDDKTLAEYVYTDKFGKYRLLELRKRGGPDTRVERPNMYYPFYINKNGDVSLEQSNEFDIEALPVKSNNVEGRWRWGIDKARQNIIKLHGKKVGNKYNVYEKNYLEGENGSRRVRPKSVLAGAAYSTDVATKEYHALMGEIDFSNPKSVVLLKDLVEYSSPPNENSLVLDFFSGSATTAHAVMQLNAEDGGNRKFIMVQLPEKTDEKSEAYKAGYKNICEIGKERIRRAGEKIKEESGLTAQNLDTGFRVLKLADSNMKDVYYSPSEYSQDMLESLESNIKDDRTDLDLLFACLLDWGLPLTKKYSSETMDNITIHSYNDGDLIACFAERISESVVNQIAEKKPQRVVFRDSCFKDSPDKINIEEIFKLISPNTAIRVI